jgi:hypothetical protein
LTRPSRRAFLSAFLVVHLAAVAVENMAAGALRGLAEPWAACYLLPMGLWQDWCMFAPEPFRLTATLEAEVRDARGHCHRFAFPSLAGKPPWRSVWSFRYPKYAHNAMNDPTPGYREVAARYAVRRLGLPASAFPVEARLFHRTRSIAPPGAPTGSSAVARIERGTYAFPSPVEVAR